jgi:P-type conjugative transfer protein TrbJ
MSKLKLLAAGFVLSASCAAAVAGGTVAGATEPTQIMNNVELIKVAMDGAVTAKKTVEQYVLQIQQYQNMLTNTMQLAGLPAGLAGDALKAYTDLMSFKQAITQLQGSLSQQQLAIERRVTEAKLSGKSWQGYLAEVAVDVAKNQKRAVERLKYEEQVLKQVQSDYTFARNLQNQIPATVGQHQSLQMLNTQMNRVITQNAKMLEVVSATIGRQAEDDALQAEGLARSAQDRDMLIQRQRALDARQRAFGGLPAQ